MKNKILIISSEFPPGPGGIGSHASNLSSQLHKRGYQIIVNTKSDYVNENQETMFDLKCPYEIIRFKRRKSILQTWIHRLKIIRSTIIKYNIKNVIVSGEFSIWTIPILKIYSDIKITTIIHGTELAQNWYKQWTLFCLRKSNKIIAVSNFTKSLIPKTLKFNTHVINNGLNVEEWSETKGKFTLKNYPILLTVGSISLRKGQYNVIKALPQIIKDFPLTHYHCVGDIRDKRSILDLIKDLRLNDKVTLHGILKHSELENMYKIAHVNMMLSNNNSNKDFEGFGISVLEGNIYGTPAIGAWESGTEDAIKNYYNGELVNPNNIKDVIGSLKSIYMNYDNYVAQSRSHAMNNDWDEKMNQYEELIQQK